MFTLPLVDFPAIDPVIFEIGPIFGIGPLAIRWYALAYVAGIVLGWRLAVRLTRKAGSAVTTLEIDDLIVWITVGIILGGRLGYILFYNFPVYLDNPLQALEIWKGGMSFHGGMLGVILAVYLFARNRNIPLFALGDVVAIVVPIGLFFGRVANFANGELWGRKTDGTWGMVFCNERILSSYNGKCPADSFPRHPSQLYEAFLEGIVLFIFLMVLERLGIRRRAMGAMTGWFLIAYAVARITCEFFREPDAQLGFLIPGVGITMGQVLSIPMTLVGIWLISGAVMKSPAVPKGSRVL